MLRVTLTGLALATLLASVCPVRGQTLGPRSDAYQRLLKEASVALLKDGNARFADGKPFHPNHDPDRRRNTLTDGQEPFATILTCSDSRLPVEVLFDRGIGDLFVVRVAGNVAGESELASLEYGVGHLSTPLLLVLGHSQCGAVSAVVGGAKLHGHIERLAQRIQPAVAKARSQDAAPHDLIARSVEANVWQSISEILRHSEVVRAAVTNQDIQVVGAIYDLNTGRVNWLGPHPNQESLLKEPQPAQPAERVATNGEPAPEQSESARRPPSNAFLLPNNDWVR